MCCERERVKREWVRVNRVYERLAARWNARGTLFHSPNRVYERVAARWNATYKGIRIQRTAYVVAPHT